MPRVAVTPPKYTSASRASTSGTRTVGGAEAFSSSASVEKGALEIFENDSEETK